ncbi:hypothetical protein SRB17_15860 [Streptomyces sp. RB17]|nr:hypothetical protein [Streptomyces sp. RB17]
MVPVTGPAEAAPDTLFAPASVAVVGASAQPGKWGYWRAKGALAGRGGGRCTW